MKNITKFTLVLGIIVGLMWLSRQHNDTYAAAPYSNISTSKISTGFLLKTNDFGTNEGFVFYFTLYDYTGTNVLAYSDGTNLYGFGQSLSFSNAYFTYLTNISIFNRVGIFTNLWAGPTNVLNVTTNHYFYKTIVPVSITGYVAGPANAAWNPVLKLYNGGSSNITVLLPANTRLPIGDSNPYTVTNGDLWIGSVDFSDGQTNIMVKVWH